VIDRGRPVRATALGPGSPETALLALSGTQRTAATAVAQEGSIAVHDPAQDDGGTRSAAKFSLSTPSRSRAGERT